MLIFDFVFYIFSFVLSLSILLTVSMYFSMYFIGVSGLRVLPLLINGRMDGMDVVTGIFTIYRCPLSSVISSALKGLTVTQYSDVMALVRRDLLLLDNWVVLVLRQRASPLRCPLSRNS